VPLLTNVVVSQASLTGVVHRRPGVAATGNPFNSLF
jgi:hypothetical protein